MEKRLTIGFIDEDTYDENHNLLTTGLYRYAREHGINVIRFGHFHIPSFTRSKKLEKILLDHMSQFRLDGIIFLGWARTTFNSEFTRLFGDIPMVSVGSTRDGIHGVFFNGEAYLGEILKHLLYVHKYRKIAYIAPIRPDSRDDEYLRIMQEQGIYDPALYISNTELVTLNLEKRGRMAVKLLLDDRGVRPEAIVSLYNEETLGVIKEIKDRGLRVPEDIAVTSYESGEIGRFSSPAYTTVYFPWRELGYYACEVMHRLLRDGSAPMRTVVPGKVIYRHSCGCVPRPVFSLGMGSPYMTGRRFDELSDSELEDIAGHIADSTPFTREEMSDLVSSFKQAFLNMEYRPFLMKFELMLRKISYHDRISDFGPAAVIFRKVIMPYFLPYFSTEMEKTIWADNIFNQMQSVLKNRLATAMFAEHVEYNRSELVLREVGKILLTNFNMDSLKESLAANLPRINLKGCWLYLFDDNADNAPFSCHLEFEYHDGKWIRDRQRRQNAPVISIDDIFHDDKPHFLLSYFLYAGEEFMGFVLAEPDQTDIRIIRILSSHLSMALNGIILFDRLDRSYRTLMEQAHKKGMADTTGILHNIANIMNSVTTTQQALESMMENSCLDDLQMANKMLSNRFEELESFVRNEDRGKLLLKFYAALGDSFIQFRDDLKGHIERLLERVSLIEAIINTQQSLTGIKSNLKRLDVIPVIDNVLKMCRSSIEKAGIKVVRSYDKSVRVLAQSTKLFHVLTNVVKNAVESMESIEGAEKVLAIEVTRDDEHVWIRVSDTGPGIEEGKLESIFAYGFTTKHNGHGFGLHSCANYMTEMKGRIWAENAKEGRGAVFVLQLRSPTSV
ncbi:MAG: substrate-binding domain-containing protein [Clostridiaceae bacterium]|nr:substrate-binding domain-containing protein [Clostridiaceae bacterium]